MIKVIKEDLDDARFGEGRCSPAINDYTEDIDKFLQNISNTRYDNTEYKKRGIKMWLDVLKENQKEIDTFNAYWSKKYYLYKNMIDANREKIEDFVEKYSE